MISPNQIASFPAYEPEARNTRRAKRASVKRRDVQRSKGREYSKISRMLVAIEFIACHRFGVTVPMLHEHLGDIFGTAQRTTFRDAARLVACGFVIDDRTEGFTKLRIDATKIVPRMFNNQNNQGGK